MVGLGIIIGAAFALITGFVFHLVSEYWHKGKICHLVSEHWHTCVFLQLLHQIGSTYSFTSEHVENKNNTQNNLYICT